MDKTDRTNLLTAVCVVLSVAAIAMSGYAIFAEDPDDGYDSVRYTVYFGMGGRSDEDVKVVEDFIVNELEERGFGYNLERETGGYDKDGTPMKDRVSLKFVITDRDAGDIHEIIDVTKERFGLKAVFLETDLVHSQFC